MRAIPREVNDAFLNDAADASRMLVRLFLTARAQANELVPGHLIGAYIAGRFDSDGCSGSRVRIAYATEDEATVDQDLLKRAGLQATSVLKYASAREYCVYIPKRVNGQFLELIRGHSWKAAAFHPVETVMASVPGKLPNL